MKKNDRQKFKRQAKGKRYVRMRLTNVIGNPEKQMLLFAEADKHAILGDHQLAAGIWRHPRTGLWQAWFSTAGSDISWISAHRSHEGASRTLRNSKQRLSVVISLTRERPPLSLRASCKGVKQNQKQ